MAEIDAKLKRMPRTVRVGIAPGGLSEFITIQAAINWCATQAVPAPSAAAPYTVQIWPGIYDETITMAANVHLKGMGPSGSVVIYQNDNNILTIDDGEVENVTLRMGTPAGGRAHVRDGAAAVSTVLRNVIFEVTTPGAVVINVFVIEGNGTDLRVENCYHNIGGTGGSYTVTSQNNPATIHLINNNFTFQNANSTHVLCLVASTITGGGNRWAGTGRMFSVTNGTIVFNNDSVTTEAAENIVGGTVCLKNGKQQYEVYEGMWIQDAIDMAAADAPVPAAANPYTVLIHPGIYNENITMNTYVHLKGIGPGNAVRLYQFDDDDIITLAAGYQEIENVTIQLDSPSQARTLITDGGAAASFTFERVRIEIITPGAFAHQVWDITGGGNFSLKHNYGNIASGAAGFHLIHVDTAAADGILIGNDFTCDQGVMMYVNIAAATISGGGNRWAGQQVSLFEVAASGLIELDGDSDETTAGSTVNLANANVVLRKDPGHFQVHSGMQIQHALNALSVGGGKIELGYGTFALTAQVLRAIDDVEIFGAGLSTRITLDGVTPVITAGAQDGWILRDFDVDAGLVDIQFATNSNLHNITINGLFSTIINPDHGVTNFPGQPVVRLEEERPLNPALTRIIKRYGITEYQEDNPIFATPEFVMELLERQGRSFQVPINSLWTANHGGTGGGTLYTTFAEVSCAAAGGDHGLFHCPGVMVNSSFDGAGQWDRVHFDNRIEYAIDLSRDAGSHADIRGRFQLKQANGEGVLAADGLGIEIQNYDIYGESFNAGRSTVNLNTTMTALYVYRVRMVHIPGVEVRFYVNDQYKGSITTVANIPSGAAAGACYWVLSIDNGAVATACVLRGGNIKVWNHL